MTIVAVLCQPKWMYTPSWIPAMTSFSFCQFDGEEQGGGSRTDKLILLLRQAVAIVNSVFSAQTK